MERPALIVDGAAWEALEAACLNGARMPSMADELATERNTLRSRVAGSRM